MFTDWILIGRLAQELEATAGRGRVTALGHLADGRVGLEVWRRDGSKVIAFDLFGPTPMVTMESADLRLEAERGFIRAAGAAVRGLTLQNTRSTRGERVIEFSLAARSRFGVPSAYALVAELVPKFGNLLLLKDGAIVAAYKEFKGRSPGSRSAIVGAPYQPPPLDMLPKAGEEELAAALDALVKSDEVDAASIRTLRACRPALPHLLAVSVLTELVHRPPAAPIEKARFVLAQADQVLRTIDAAALADPLLAYRRQGALVQTHVVPLHQYDGFECSPEAALLPLLAEARRGSAAAQGLNRIVQRRAELHKTLQQRARKVQAEIAAIEPRLAMVTGRGDLRAQGESIFATLHELSDSERAGAKERAASLFARYKRLGTSIAPLQRRLVGLLQQRDDLEQLAWELNRVTDDDLVDVAGAIEKFSGRRSKVAASTTRRKRRRLAFQTQAGSRILVGRSPVENAELTFEVARPNDLWFHAQNIPGAHVILQRDDRAPPSAEDIALAASLAAHFSKAQESPKVTVAYTLRKYVRKRPAAAPGLVFYTNPKSVLVAPHAPSELEALSPH